RVPRDDDTLSGFGAQKRDGDDAVRLFLHDAAAAEAFSTKDLRQKAIGAGDGARRVRLRMLREADAIRRITVDAKSIAKAGVATDAQRAIMRREIRAGRLVAAVVIKLVVKNDVRALGPGVSRALNQKMRLLLHRRPAWPAGGIIGQPCRAGVIVPRRYAGFVHPDGPLQAEGDQRLPYIEHEPAAAPRIAVAMYGDGVDKPVVLRVHRVVDDLVQHSR